MKLFGSSTLKLNSYKLSCEMLRGMPAYYRSISFYLDNEQISRIYLEHLLYYYTIYPKTREIIHYHIIKNL